MAGGDELKLIGTWPSAFVTRVQLTTLSLKGLSYENVGEDLSNKSGLLLNSNPVHKKVPVLIHNGKPIPESLVIVQYVDEVWSATGPSILPADPYDRAIARFWAAYVDDKELCGAKEGGRDVGDAAVDRDTRVVMAKPTMQPARRHRTGTANQGLKESK